VKVPKSCLELNHRTLTLIKDIVVHLDIPLLTDDALAIHVARRCKAKAITLQFQSHVARLHSNVCREAVAQSSYTDVGDPYSLAPSWEGRESHQIIMTEITS